MRSGAAPTAVLWILVLVVVVAVLAVFLASGGVGHAGGEERLAEPPPAAVGSEPEPSLSVAGPTRTGAPVATVIRPREGLPAPVDPAEVHSPERFLGAGTLRVHARVAAGTALPERWTLVLGPSKALIGGEHAERRRVERGSDDGLTVLEGVALGGYELRVESERMRSDPVHVMLARPGRTDRSVFLELSPAGYLIGQVADTAGLDVEGLELLLERADGAVSRATVTDVRGTYRFEHVLDGDYQLHVGGTANPLLHPIELQFLAPSLTMPLIEVPELGELEIRVLDAAGFELEGASVKGWGRDGGRVDAVTDVRGTCVARFLPPGPYSLIVEHPEHGSARRRTELRRSERAEVEIRLGE